MKYLLFDVVMCCSCNLNQFKEIPNLLLQPVYYLSQTQQQYGMQDLFYNTTLIRQYSILQCLYVRCLPARGTYKREHESRTEQNEGTII